MQNRGLEVFLIGGTNITGPLPSCFFDATSTLKQFYASLSGISGEFPTTFGESTQLQLFQAYGVSCPRPAMNAASLPFSLVLQSKPIATLLQRL